MWIKRIRVESFQGFEDSGWLEFGEGFNLILGQNNSGKSALLKSLVILENNPHRSAERFKLNYSSRSQVSIDLLCSGEKIAKTWLELRASVQWLAGGSEPTEKSIAKFIGSPAHTLDLSRFSGQNWQLRSTSVYGFAKEVNPRMEHFRLSVDPDGTFRIERSIPQGPAGFDYLVTTLIQRQVFYFDAQRYSIGRAGFSVPVRLDANAGNLPLILLKLSGERRSVFSALERHMAEIFPSVNAISVVPTGNNEVEIRVWPTPDHSAPELSIPLNDCGTGISQALAILTVAMTMEQAVIAIDEIGSFLHPAAAKNLIRILVNYYGQHQYIVTTHTVDTLSIPNISTVHIVEKHGFSSLVRPIDTSKLEHLRQVASQLGISMSDVFAAEHIVWVEGPTEEVCFKLILEKCITTNGYPPRFISLVATGDVSGRGAKKRLILEIYRRLSAAAQPLVQQVSFGFDRENLSDKDVTDLERSDGDRIKILKRRLFECYLLDVDAIVSVINSELTENLVSCERVHEWLAQHAGDTRYASSGFSGDPADANWLKKVDAAKLLQDLFASLTEARVTYVKTRHSVALLKAILERSPSHLDELVRYVKELAEKSGVSATIM